MGDLDQRYIGLRLSRHRCLCHWSAYAADPPSPSVISPSTDVRGTWDLSITFTDSDANHQIILEQDGIALTGTHHTLFHTAPISGSILDNRISLHSLHPFEGMHLAYSFEGVVKGDHVGGRVYLGTSGQSAPGPLNQQEYGTVTWQGQHISER